MSRTIRPHCFLWVLPALAVVLVLGSAPADADDWDSGCRARRGHGHGTHVSVRSGCGPCAAPCGGYRARAFGGSWAALRRYITPTGAALRYFYVRNYFLRRYPHLYARGEPPRGQVIEREHFLHPRYAVATTPRTPLQNLNYGMWQLHLGDYKEARLAFGKVPRKDKVHVQAAYGLLMSATSLSDWDTAAADLAHLSRIGALDASDRLDSEELFGEKGKLANVMATMREHVRWQFEDGNAQLVGGWLYAAQGNTRMARVYLKKAKRNLEGNPAVRTLLDGLDKKPAAQPKPDPAPDTKTQPKPRAPDAVVADAKPILVSAAR